MSFARDTNGSCTTECVSGDCPAEVKHKNCTVVKQEPDDVCFVGRTKFFKILYIVLNSLLIIYVFHLGFVCVCCAKHTFTDLVFKMHLRRRLQQTCTHTRFTAFFLCLPRWASTTKAKINLDFTEARVAVASAGLYASLHLAPDR